MYKDLSKGFDMPIIPLALNNYYLNGTPIRDTICNHDDIMDYCSAVKVGSSFSSVYYLKDDVKQDVQKSIRYYVSNDGGYLFKVKESEPTWDNMSSPEHIAAMQQLLAEGKKVTANHAIEADTKVTVFNDYVEKDNIADYNINYDYYIEEVKKLIAAIENTTYVDPKKLEAKKQKVRDNIAKSEAKWDDFVLKGKTGLKSAQLVNKRLNDLYAELEKLHNLN